MSANPISAIAKDRQVKSVNSLSNKPQAGAETSPLLPRSAWNSQLTYFKAVLRAKLNLDKAEREAIEAAKESTAK